jgi:hypothetical protein
MRPTDLVESDEEQASKFALPRRYPTAASAIPSVPANSTGVALRSDFLRPPLDYGHSLR